MERWKENSHSHTYTQPTNGKQQTLVLCKQCHWTSRYCKKENKHTNITKKNKTITGDNSANGRGNIFTKKKWNKHKIEKTQIKKWLRNLTGSGRLKTKQKKTLNKERRRFKKRVPYEGDETERKRMHTLLNEKKGKW